MSLGVPPAQFPAKGSPQIAGTRNKIALKPGHSLLDWIRFSKNAKDLPGTGGRVIKVTPDELAKHNTRDDCWMAIRGVVYNVSAYMEYHPGGEDELMRGAGIDATNLFDEVHRWVNVESMLAHCVVGPYICDSFPIKALPANEVLVACIGLYDSALGYTVRTDFLQVLQHRRVITESMLKYCHVGLFLASSPIVDKARLKNGQGGSQSSLSSSGSSNLLPPVSSSGSTGELDGPPTFSVPVLPKKKQSVPRYEWFQTDEKMTIVVYTRYKDIQTEHLIIDKTAKDFKLAIRMQHNVYSVHLELEDDVQEEYSVKVSRPSGKCEITLCKVTVGKKWTRIGTALDGHESLIKISEAEASYRACRILDITEVTHDCMLYHFALPKGTRMCIPLGYHVYLEASVEGVKIARAYTVVPASLEKDNLDTRLDGSSFHLLIKIYEDGALTPLIGKLKIGDTFDVANYEGNFDESQLTGCDELVMLAAGTGITPMLALLQHVLYNIYNEDRCIKLMFFNKEERDIIMRESLDELTQNFPKVQIKYILSQPSSTWTGATGRINKQLVEEFMLPVSEGKSILCCACGPTPFTEAAVRYAKEMGYTDEMIHAFLG